MEASFHKIRGKINYSETYIHCIFKSQFTTFFCHHEHFVNGDARFEFFSPKPENLISRQNQKIEFFAKTKKIEFSSQNAKSSFPAKNRKLNFPVKTEKSFFLPKLQY